MHKNLLTVSEDILQGNPDRYLSGTYSLGKRDGYVLCRCWSSLSLEGDPLALELRPQIVRVVDGAVVHKGDAVAVVHVGVRVLVGFTACASVSKKQQETAEGTIGRNTRT